MFVSHTGSSCRAPSEDSVTPGEACSSKNFNLDNKTEISYISVVTEITVTENRKPNYETVYLDLSRLSGSQHCGHDLGGTDTAPERSYLPDRLLSWEQGIGGFSQSSVGSRVLPDQRRLRGAGLAVRRAGQRRERGVGEFEHQDGPGAAGARVHALL